MRYFLRLSYDGTPFHGWQRQPNAGSVQESLEEALGKVLREPTPIVGAGRTDTGVHARTMYAHFDTPEAIDTYRVCRALNRLCGRSIAIHDIVAVPDDAHARFDATQRTYKYFVLFRKSPFFTTMAWHSPSPLDIEAMNRAAALLLDTEDFTSFAKLHSDSKTNICRVTDAHWQPLEGVDGIVFTITADRFLRNMVRAVVGTLVDVGRGKLSLDDFARIIATRDRCAAGTSMPAHALYLWEVRYPYLPNQ